MTIRTSRSPIQLFIGLILGLLFFGLYLSLTHAMPERFSVDGYLNYGATRYLVEHGKMPVVSTDNPDVIFSQVGATRSLRPPLTYIVNALGFHLTEDLISDKQTRYHLGSSLLGALTVVATFWICCLLTGKILFGLLGATLVGLMPRFAILSSTSNDDIGAIFSVAVVALCLMLIRNHRDSILSWLMLAAAVGLVLQSKFTAYLCLPWVALVLIPFLRETRVPLFAWSPLMVVLGILLGGWWLLFNMVLYGWTDPLAFTHAASLQQQLTGEIPNRQGYWSQGITLVQLLGNHEHFLIGSYASALGALYWINLPVSSLTVVFYSLVVLFALISLWRLKGGGSRFCVIAVWGLLATQWGFYIHHNLLRDIQPDGRYLLPVLVPLVCIAVAGNANLLHGRVETSTATERTIVVLLILICAAGFIQNAITYWVPAGLQLS